MNRQALSWNYRGDTNNLKIELPLEWRERLETLAAREDIPLTNLIVGLLRVGLRQRAEVVTQ